MITFISRIALFVAFVVFAALNPAAAQNSDRNRSSGQPGKFDFYVLALSWSPSFCQDTEERGRDGGQQCSTCLLYTSPSPRD